MSFTISNANTGVDALAAIKIFTSGSGDSTVEFGVTGATDWAIGIDNSDSDIFKINNDALADSSLFAIDGNGNVVVGRLAQLAAGATDGFLHIPEIATAPTAAPPTTYTGKVPFVYDTTNSKLWVYDGGWVGIALA